jgi:predicted nucleic acid-binding protein
VTAISNTTVISNFAAIEQIDALRLLFGTLHISTEVLEEIHTGLEEGYRFYAGLEALVDPSAEHGWLKPTSVTVGPELTTFVALPRRLHRGEASCLAIALHRGWLLVTDDEAARRQARDMGVRYTGTLGCLVLMVERDMVTLEDANAWLGAMVERNYRSPVNRIDDLLAE